MNPVPGQVTAAFITPTCRANKGDAGAWDEAVERLREQYNSICEGWRDKPEQPTLNVVLTMERPTHTDHPDGARGDPL